MTKGGTMIKSLALFASPARRSFLWAAAVLAVVILNVPAAVADEEGHGKQKWVASWAASAHGLYPSGTAVAQPDLEFAFPSADTGANDQTFAPVSADRSEEHTSELQSQ